jgi:hypothetical protein
MQTQNTTENIFRFVQIRAAAPARIEPRLELLSNTTFAKQLLGADPSQRKTLSIRFLDELKRAGPALNETAKLLLTKLETVSARDGSVWDLPSAVTIPQDQISSLHQQSSDFLLATKFASGEIGNVPEIERLFRVTNLLLETFQFDSESKLSDYLRRPLGLPVSFRTSMALAREQPQHSRKSQRSKTPATSIDPNLDPKPLDARAIYQALEEVVASSRPELMHLPASSVGASDANTPLFTLNDRGLKRLSPDTRRVLSELDLDVTTMSIDNLIQGLEAEVFFRANRLAEKGGGLLHGPSSSEELRPYIRDVGIADLLVVKQHLVAYERVDIAHVENILIGEKKSRNHRALERTEDTFTTERETIHERETELETAERFELNRETARTLKRDQQFGFGLTLSGKYGPTIEFSSNLQASVNTSTEESVRSATRYAKDVVERSLERVVERVREEQVRRVVREQEETNLHELENETAEHISGVYQFLEKIYESQVFNYGIRQMFDFMVPEPASYLWHIENNEQEINLPLPPPDLGKAAANAYAINSLNYVLLAAAFGADGIEHPPQNFITSSASIVHGIDASATEQGRPRSVLDTEVPVPEGYVPFRAIVRPLALTDHDITIGITIGHNQRIWKPHSAQLTGVGSDHSLGSARLDLPLLLESQPFDSSSKLPIHVLAFETESYSFVVEVIFLRTGQAYRNWQIKTYDKLVTAYRESLQQYEATIAELKAAAKAEAAQAAIRFGAPPSQNLKTIRTELKKHCISIVTRQRYEDFDAVQEGDPPYFDFIEAAEGGSFTRFFEQAFEWDQMQYVFYPYFWGHQNRWSKRFLRQDVDPIFLEFLQSGAARVVVPVRPGFETALTYYLEKGTSWNGEGDPPIESPLYVPIIKEIQERTGASQGEVAVGEPWPTRIPTPLVILRKENTLPEWERLNQDKWEWRERL